MEHCLTIKKTTMKNLNKLLFISVILFGTHFCKAQVGIGTNAPASSAALDVTSNDKGLLLPRLADTSAVTSPTAGLLIYNANTKTPAFHDGIMWNTLSRQPATTTPDSISYTITTPSMPFAAGIFKVYAVSLGVSNPGSTSFGMFQSVSFVKFLDANTTGITRQLAIGGAVNGMLIEIKVFNPGAVTPKYSVKITNPIFSSQSISFASLDGGIFSEQVSVTGSILGFKNWISNLSFGWNTVNNTVTSY